MRITGASGSGETHSDSGGHYAFSSLCSGSYTLQATLPSGQLTLAATVTVDGQNTYQMDLTTAPAATLTVVPTGTAEALANGDESMPATGYSGWLLVGGAVLGIVLLLSAGARRTLGSRQH